MVWKLVTYQPNHKKNNFIEKNILTYFRSLFIHRITFEPDYILCPHPKNMGFCAPWSSNSYEQDRDSIKVKLQIQTQI